MVKWVRGWVGGFVGQQKSALDLVEVFSRLIIFVLKVGSTLELKSPEPPSQISEQCPPADKRLDN